MKSHILGLGIVIGILVTSIGVATLENNRREKLADCSAKGGEIMTVFHSKKYSGILCAKLDNIEILK